jgi:MYXO-CTERM domain-containing protein
MKRIIAVLAVLLVVPTTAFARLPDGPISNAQIRTGSLSGLPPQDLRNPDRAAPVQARGTDVAAWDQQSPKLFPASSRVVTPAHPTSGFDWAAAAVGAGIAALMLGAAGTLRRRHGRSPSVVTG